jgi:hypothetical protein
MRVYKLVVWHDYEYYDLLGIYDTRPEAEIAWYNIETGNSQLPENIKKEKSKKPGTYIWLQIIEQEDDRVPSSIKSFIERLKILRQDVEDNKVSVNKISLFDEHIQKIEEHVSKMETYVGEKIKKDF